MSPSHAARVFRVRPTVVAVSMVLAALPAFAQNTSDTANAPTTSQTLDEVRVLGTAEEQVKQGLGTSIITRQDLEERPPANDISEILRTQPGVNLTGSSATGNYGNQRQIDIRGMGPENTLILIDGKPVLSRNGAIMNRGGERDTHGDTNWVPVDAIERIEVIRGPAAARYGSGAAGGVVNIITKKATDKWTGSFTTYYNRPENSDEGATWRNDFLISGPISDRLSFRLYGNVAKTDADSLDINGDASAAGREGTRNKDIDAMLHWQLTPDQSLEFQAGYSRQGNIFTGEYVTTGRANTSYDGTETRRVYRQTASVTHRGNWGVIGDSRVTLQVENTRTTNCLKGFAGGVASDCVLDDNNQTSFLTSTLKEYYLNGELHTPLKIGGLDQVLTSGLEFHREELNDPNSILAAQASSNASVAANAESYAKASENNFAMYLEDNIEVTRKLILTPGLRMDHYDDYGNNWSPSLNATYEVAPEWTVKGGVARVFKAPNLYQTNPYYFWQSRGGGCPSGYNPCQIQGDPNLEPEVSINKEIGVAWDNRRGWNSSLTYFRNDYKNKIATDLTSDSISSGGYWVTRWVNSGKALIHGLEGNFNVPLLGESGSRLKLNNNATWMFASKSKETGQPLTIIPKYTLNSTLDWHINELWQTQLTATFYGRQKPRTTTTIGTAATGTALREVGAYSLFGWNATYRINKNYRLGFGISNLFDKIITREGKDSATGGAATYNDPGRAYYVTFSGQF